MFLIDAAKLIPRVKASVDLEGERLGHGSLVGRAKGRCTNDVCTEGEGGGQPNSDKRKGGCVNLVLTRGGRGSKIPKI